MTERWRSKPTKSSPRPPTPLKGFDCSAWPGAPQASKDLAGRTWAMGGREMEEKGRAQLERHTDVTLSESLAPGVSP